MTQPPMIILLHLFEYDIQPADACDVYGKIFEWRRVPKCFKMESRNYCEP